MSEQTRPQPPREIDREDVLGELEHRFKEADPSHAIAWVLDELVELDILSFRERADDPDQDEICTVRRGPDGELAVVTETEHNHEDIRYRWRLLAAGDRRPTSMLIPSERVVGWPVVWSPAAEASGLVTFLAPADWRLQLDGADPAYLLESWQVSGPAEARTPYSVTLVLPCGHDTTEHGPECPNPADGMRAREARGEDVQTLNDDGSDAYARAVADRDPLTMEQRQRVASLLVDGRKSDAVALVAAIGMPHDKALTYVESMPEWQTGRNHRPVKDVPLVAGTRVFTSDGPEPPHDVECVRFFGTPDRLNGLFLRRSVGLQLRWVWVADPEADVTAMVGGTNWPVPNARGSFTEVV